MTPDGDRKAANCGDDEMTLPAYVVIGAMKAGTVSLRHNLDEDPTSSSERRAICCGRRVLPELRARPQLPRSRKNAAGHPGGASHLPGARGHRPHAVDVHASVSAGRERRNVEDALLDDRYLGPSLYGFQLAAFLDHFDRSQVLVIASEVCPLSPYTGVISASAAERWQPSSDRPGYLAKAAPRPDPQAMHCVTGGYGERGESGREVRPAAG